MSCLYNFKCEFIKIFVKQRDKQKVRVESKITINLKRK